MGGEELEDMLQYKQLTDKKKVEDRIKFFGEREKIALKEGDEVRLYNPAYDYALCNIGDFIDYTNPGTFDSKKAVIVWVDPSRHHLYVSNRAGKLDLLATGIR